MWSDLARLLPTFRSAVLTGLDADGYPFSLRCQPSLEPTTQTIRIPPPPGVAIQPGPASLLCHQHDEQLWNQRSLLVRGTLRTKPDGWVLEPRQLIPGLGIGGPLAMIRGIVAARRTAGRYLAARRLARPRIPWADINAVKARIRS
jgi:hypothetical protein